MIWTFHVSNRFWKKPTVIVSMFCFFCSNFCKNNVSYQHSKLISSIFLSIYTFIHKDHSSMNMWQNMNLYINKDFVLCVKEYFHNILSIWTKYSKNDSFLLMCSCSWAHGLASLHECSTISPSWGCIKTTSIHQNDNTFWDHIFAFEANIRQETLVDSN